jgi:RNA polymerase sigma-70 factor (ECF subfamily)
MASISTQPTDAELVNSAKSGNRKSFDQIVERYFGLVFAVAFSRLRHRESAEDLAQEVFLRAYLNLDKVQQSELIAGWLVRVTQNLAIDWIRQGNRKSKLITMVPLDEMTTDIPNTKEKNGREVMMNLDQNKALQSALFRLPEDQREMVLLHYTEGYSHREIAKYLSVHPSTVGRQLRQAVKSMQSSIVSILQDTAPSFRPHRKVMLQTIAIISATAVMSAQSKASLVTAAAGTTWIPVVVKSSSPSIIKIILNTLFNKQNLGLIGKGIAILAVGGVIYLGINKYLNKPSKFSGDKPAAVAMIGSRASRNSPGIATTTPTNQPFVAVARDINHQNNPTESEPALPPNQPEKDSSILTPAPTTTQYPITTNNTNQLHNDAALSILDRYKATQDNLKSFALKYEDTIDRDDQYKSGPYVYLSGKRKIYDQGELRSDGFRHSIQIYRWGQLGTKLVTQDSASFHSLLWDGKAYIRYSSTEPSSNSGNRDAFIGLQKKESWNEEIIVVAYSGSMLMGYIPFTNNGRVDTILRQQQIVSVRTRQEYINGFACDVIDAYGKYGTYTLWLDPQHDNHIAQMEVFRKEGDLVLDKPAEKGYYMRHTLKNVRFEKINERWVPMEATIEEQQTFPTGTIKYTLHHKRTSIILNPDFNATNAFIPTYIKNSTKLWIDKTGPRVNYTWQNGVPVDSQGKRFAY